MLSIISLLFSPEHKIKPLNHRHNIQLLKNSNKSRHRLFKQLIDGFFNKTQLYWFHEYPGKPLNNQMIKKMKITSFVFFEALSLDLNEFPWQSYQLIIY